MEERGKHEFGEEAQGGLVHRPVPDGAQEHRLDFRVVQGTELGQQRVSCEPGPFAQLLALEEAAQGSPHAFAGEAGKHEQILRIRVVRLGCGFIWTQF